MENDQFEQTQDDSSNLNDLGTASEVTQGGWFGSWDGGLGFCWC